MGIYTNQQRNEISEVDVFIGIYKAFDIRSSRLK